MPADRASRAYTLLTAFPPAHLQESDATRKDRQTAKKNRLDTTEEEATDDPTPPRAGTPVPTARAHMRAADYDAGCADPTLSMSPPHEVKMRHISRRVEHINWKSGEPQVVPLEVDVAAASADVEFAPPPELSPVFGESRTQEEDAPGCRSPRRRSMDSIRSTGSKRARDDADEGDGSHDSKRPSPPADADLEAGEDTTPPVSQEDKDTEGSLLKRRSMDSIMSAGGTKRRRDDADHDANPREAKRPSPPPEKLQKTPEAAPAPAATTKLVRSIQPG